MSAWKLITHCSLVRIGVQMSNVSELVPLVEDPQAFYEKRFPDSKI
jgi:hypothetical protein